LFPFTDGINVSIEAMKVLVQHHETKLFVQEGGDWIEAESAAKDFGDALNAIQFCYNNALAKASVVLMSQQGKFTLPLNCWE
jgi:hypothetical protein